MPRGRPPSAKTLVDRQLGRNIKQPILPAGESYIIPNLSGMKSHPEAKQLDYVPRDYVNGSMKAAFNALVTSDGATITMTLTNVAAGDHVLKFSDGDTNFTSGQTIALTAGSDASPQENFIYILKSDKILTKSTSAWPSAEHNKIGYFLVPSAAFVQTNGCYVNQNWNDFMGGSDNQGHMLHITEAMRRRNARYFSGVAGNGTSNYLTVGAGTTDLKTTAGVVYQLHEHAFPAYDTSAGDVVLVKNWSGDSFHDITDLYDITADSTGATIGNNKFFNLVIWGVANKTNEFQPLMINLPGGFYNTQAAAEQDIDGVDDFDMAREFNLESSTGFLIARITIQMKTGGGTWVVSSTTDLRGISPSSASGGVASPIAEFHDNTFRIVDEGDESKELAFSVGGVSAATTRTVTIPDADGTILYNMLEDTTPELGGEMDAGAHTIGFTQGSATGDGTTTIDWKLGNKFFFTFGNQNDTFTFTAPSNPCNLILVLKQYSTGGKTATWPAAVKWPGGVAPTLSTGNNDIDIIAFYYDGTNYYGVGSLDFS